MNFKKLTMIAVLAAAQTALVVPAMRRGRSGHRFNRNGSKLHHECSQRR